MKRRELCLLVLAGALLAWVLFLPGFIGIANNGDFSKISGRLCLGGANGESDDFVYFQANYLRDANHCYEAHIDSSEHWIAWVASNLERRIADPARFDIRCLGAVHALGWLIAFALLLVSIRPLDGPGWWIAAAGSLLIFFDVTYISYLNSFYTDAAALIGAFMMIAVLPMMLKQAVWWPVFGAAAFLFLTSKSQHGLLFAIPASTLFLVAWHSKRILAAISGCALLGGAIWVIRGSQEAIMASPRFSLIFSKLLPASRSPERDAKELGLIPADMKYVGINAFQSGSPTVNPAWVEDFCRRNNNATLIRFYFRHPSVPLHLLWDVLSKEAWQLRASNISNFRREDGHPPWAQTRRMSLWSAFRSRLFVLWPAHAMVLYFLAFAGGLWKRNWPILFAAALGVGEFAIASLGDAVETYRHLLLFHFFTDTLIFLALVEAASHGQKRKKAAYRSM